MKNTNIIATLGPVSCDPKMLLALRAAGMDMVRLNGSHNTLNWHSDIIDMVHEFLPDTPILLDIPGKKIRTLQLAIEPNFLSGDIIILTTDKEFQGDKKVPISNEDLHLDLKMGQKILADDGTLEFEVVDIIKRDIYIKAKVSGTLKSRKGINVPGIDLSRDLISSSDKQMILFAQKKKIDFIGLSFVESHEHIKAFRDIISPLDYPRIVSKIENQAGLDNMIDVIDSSDAIMIDRGDLSVETNLESIALMQKEIIMVAKTKFKPVIVATELLHTMTENSFPTKAEVSDVCNAVLDGASAVMLSGETAIGKNPEAAVSLMYRVINETENFMRQKSKPNNFSTEVDEESIADAIEIICRGGGITKVVAVTRTGFSARVLAGRNLSQPILAVSDNSFAAKSFNLLSGVKGLYYPNKFPQDGVDHVVDILHILKEKKELTDDDNVLTVSVGYPRSGNRMNVIQIYSILNLFKDN